MAQKKSPEERQMLINLVGEHFLKTGDSTREIAAYFTDLGFPLSNATVSDYISRYKKQNLTASIKIQERIDDNTPKGVEDAAVRTRVMYVTKFFLQNHTAEEIALAFNTTPSVVYRDLSERLPLIEARHTTFFPNDSSNVSSTMKSFYDFFGAEEGQNISSLVEEKLQNNSLSNLQPKSRK